MESERAKDRPPGPSRFLSLPNLLSLSRIPLGGVFAVVLWRSPHDLLGPFAILAAAGVTDVLDGYFARRSGVVSGVGSWLDPICDKLFLALVVGAIFVQRHAPLSLLALIGSRELVQLPLMVAYQLMPALRHWLRYDFRASPLGKAATVFQFLAVTALLLNHPSVWGLALAAFAIGVTAVLDYLRRVVVISRERWRNQDH